MNISYDNYQTTDDYHVKAVQKIFRKLYENGDIYAFMDLLQAL